MRKKTFGVVGLTLVTIALSGCAQRTWMKAGASQGDFGSDKYSCERDARQSGYFGGGIVGTLNMQEFFGRCMNSKGWRLEDKQKAETEVADTKATIKAATDNKNACRSTIRNDPTLSPISSRLSDEKTGRYSFEQMSSQDMPSQSDVALLKKYFSEMDKCLQAYSASLSGVLPPEKYQIFEKLYADVDADAARLVRRQTSYGEWATHENQAMEAAHAALKGH